jgi:Peptidase inhibitor I9
MPMLVCVIVPPLIPGFYVVYVGTFSAKVLELLKQHPSVEYVVEDTEMTTCVIDTQYLFLDRPC